VSETKQEFVQKHIVGDGHCLFSSLCYVLRSLQKNTIKGLRKKVADFILQSDAISDEVLLDDTHNTREQYCDLIKNTNKWGGELEIRAIGKLHGVIVCVVKMIEVRGIISSVYVTEFPENESSFEKCVYIIYLRNNHYEPLYLRNGNNSNEEITTFNRNDTTVKKLLREFFQKKFGCKKKYEFEMKTKDIIVNLIIDDGIVKFCNKTDEDRVELESHLKGRYMT